MKDKLNDTRNKRYAGLVKFAISNEWTEKDEKAAFAKLAHVALHYDVTTDVRLEVGVCVLYSLEYIAKYSQLRTRNIDFAARLRQRRFHALPAAQRPASKGLGYIADSCTIRGDM